MPAVVNQIPKDKEDKGDEKENTCSFSVFLFALIPELKTLVSCKTQREIKIIHAYTVYMDILKELFFFL